MSFLRDIVSDLREKRLWPFAALLVVALVAVPVVLGRGGNPPAATPIPLPAAPAAPTTTTAAADASHAVSLVAPSGRRHAKGRRHDPFGTPGGAAKPAATTPSPVGSSTGSGSSSSSGSTTTSTTPKTTTTPTKPAAPTGVAAGYRVDVSFGPAGATKSMHDVLRLRPLTTEAGPLGLLAGVRQKPARVVFLLAPGAVATGDGRCRPNPKQCQVLELGKDQSEFFDVTTATGVVQYELDIDRITARTEATAAAARRTLRKVSPAGKKLLTTLVAGGQTFLRDHYAYKTADGLLESHTVAVFAGG